MKEPCFIFFHVPKTGGTYLNLPTITSTRGRDHDMRFSEFEKSIKNKKTITILRDPYEVSCSQYFAIKRGDFVGPDIKKNKEIYYLINRKKMSLESFLEFRDFFPFYEEYFDTKTPKNFDYVGITEEMDKFKTLLKIVFDLEVATGITNKNPDKEIYENYFCNYDRKKFEKENPEEYQMYYEAIEKFNQLCQEYNIN